MVMREMGWFGVAVACALFGGCKSGPTDAEPVSQNDLPGALASVVCDSLGGCCSSAKLVFDSTNCRGAESARIRAKLNDTLTGAVEYDAEAAGECVVELKKRAKCGNLEIAEDIPACNDFLVGTLAAGQPCENSEECASGYCSTDSLTFERTCVVSVEHTPVARGKAGDACEANCEDADSCSFSAPTGDVIGEPVDPSGLPVACYRTDSLYCNGTCQPLQAIGENCTDSSACKDGLFCDFDSSICTAPHPDGAACDSDYECQSDHCDLGTGSGSEGTCAGATVTAQQCADGML